jgi:Tfp pilus assembly protein PilF
MEVAMLNLPGLMRQAIVATLAVVSLMSLAGCTETFTYANRSRREGVSLYDQKAYEDAAGAFRTAIRQDPRDYESQYYLARCYDQMNLHQQAFGQYRTALDVVNGTYGGKNDPEFRAKIIDAYAQSVARYDEGAIETNALEQKARKMKRAQEWLILAKAQRLRGDADSAITAYRNAVNWSPNDFSIRKDFGLYLLDPLNQKDQAELQLSLAYRLNQNDQEVVAALRGLGKLPPPVAPPPNTDSQLSRPVAPGEPAGTRTVVAPRD